MTPSLPPLLSGRQSQSSSFLSPRGTAGDGEPRTVQVLRAVQQKLGRHSLDQLERIFNQADDLRDGEGFYGGPGPDPVSGDRRGDRGFDLLPLVIGGAEWAWLEAGLSQRVRAWDLFLRDIYSGQEILRSGVVPFEIVYGDPNFHRGCARLAGVIGSYLQFAAFDLQQDAQGRWLVLADHLDVAEGATYAARKRHTLRQVAPRLFEGEEILPVEDFAVQLTDHLLAHVGTEESRGRIVLLARGSRDTHYLDHAALARQMGVPIVQGSDLVVIDSRLYLKTIAGVEPVDVVLRRLATALIDPVTFDSASRFGVPGLLSCVRRGKLAVANGLGSDLANNRALAAYLPAILDYYTGERPLLPSPPVYEMRDLDRREQVLDGRDDYVLRHAWKRGPGYEWVARHLNGPDWHRLWQQVEAAPGEYVATRLPSPTLHPGWTPGGTRPAPVTLRAFSLGRERVAPCALAWSGPGQSPSGPGSPMIDRAKDVWILHDVAASPVTIYAQAEEAPHRLRLTSRVAESFFWMGRYAERAEGTARCLRIVQVQPWPQNESPVARQRRPLWAALAVLVGHLPDFFSKMERPPRESSVPFSFLLDRKQAGSVLSCLQSCRQNAENSREHLPPEVWLVLNRIYLQLALAADQAETETVRLALEERSLHQEIIAGLDELTGAVQKHMLHNDAWHFWRMGAYAERSLMTIQTLKSVVTPEIEPNGRPGPVSAANLDLLLQIAAGQYAYRSLYQARPVAARVVRLLLQDGEFPRSALFCLHRMREALAATLGGQPMRGSHTPIQHCLSLGEEIDQLDMETFFPRAGQDRRSPEIDNLTDQPTAELASFLGGLTQRLLEFNVLISDHYLDHQVVFREPELFDLPGRAR